MARAASRKEQQQQQQQQQQHPQHHQQHNYQQRSFASSSSHMLSTSTASAAATAGTVTTEPAAEEEETFRLKSARFEEAEGTFRALVQSLAAYKTAIMKMTDCGLDVAIKIDQFFGDRHAHRELAAKYRDAQTAVRDKWVGDIERRYDTEVIRPIKSRVDEIPKVRECIKQRAAALCDMQRWQKRINSSRRRDASRMREKQRRLQEHTDRYAMHHAEVIRRFSYMERNLGNFVSPSLGALVSLLSEFSASTVTTLEEVEALVASAPPMTRDLSPLSARPPTRHDPGGAVDSEAWDDDFDDSINESRMSLPSQQPPKRTHVVSGSMDSTSPLAFSFSSPSSPRASQVPNGLSMAPASAPASVAISASASAMSEPTPSNLHLRSAIAPAAKSIPNPRDGPAYFGTSADSSTSTEHFLPDVATRVRAASSAGAATAAQNANYDRRERREKMGSGDTVPSVEGAPRPDVLMRLRVLYDFSPRETNEIELRKGDVIEVHEKTDYDWWIGRCRRSTGFFPRNYTRELTEDEELEYVKDKQLRKRERRHGHRRRDSRESRRSGRSASHASEAVPL